MRKIFLQLMLNDYLQLMSLWNVTKHFLRGFDIFQMVLIFLLIEVALFIY